jgi:hypothetical protein
VKPKNPPMGIGPIERAFDRGRVVGRAEALLDVAAAAVRFADYEKFRAWLAVAMKEA